MKRLRKIMRICALVLFMLFAVAGVSLFGVAPTLTKDGKLFEDLEAVTKVNDEEKGTSIQLPGIKN